MDCTKLLSLCADSRFAEPRNFLRGRTGCHFLHRAKSNQKAHQRFANLWTPGTIQIAGRYVFEAKVTGFHQVTGNAEICNFSSIAGNDLNRCDAPALQYNIRANRKRTAVFFANSRLRVVGMGSGGQKRKVFSAHAKLTDKKKLISAQKNFNLPPHPN